jgi:pyruvate kinase
LIGKISSLRPKAFIIVFTDKPEVKGAVAIRFGVYCYKKTESGNAQAFL